MLPRLALRLTARSTPAVGSALVLFPVLEVIEEPLEIRSVALAGVRRITGSAIAVAAAVDARVERVFAFLKMIGRRSLHASFVARETAPCPTRDFPPAESFVLRGSP